VYGERREKGNILEGDGAKDMQMTAVDFVKETVDLLIAAWSYDTHSPASIRPWPFPNSAPLRGRSWITNTADADSPPMTHTGKGFISAYYP
jgi:hypothetical protein